MVCIIVFRHYVIWYTGSLCCYFKMPSLPNGILCLLYRHSSYGDFNAPFIYLLICKTKQLFQQMHETLCKHVYTVIYWLSWKCITQLQLHLHINDRFPTLRGYIVFKFSKCMKHCVNTYTAIYWLRGNCITQLQLHLHINDRFPLMDIQNTPCLLIRLPLNHELNIHGRIDGFFVGKNNAQF